jgi:hypothetical protein
MRSPFEKYEFIVDFVAIDDHRALATTTGLLDVIEPKILLTDPCRVWRPSPPQEVRGWRVVGVPE